MIPMIFVRQSAFGPSWSARIRWALSVAILWPLRALRLTARHPGRNPKIIDAQSYTAGVGINRLRPGDCMDIVMGNGEVVCITNGQMFFSLYFDVSRPHRRGFKVFDLDFSKVS